MNANYKALFWGVLLIAIAEGALIYFGQDLTNRVTLPPYSFTDLKSGFKAEQYPSFDSDSLVTAQGSWISSTKQANPLSTVTIQCWRDRGNCLIADATLMNLNGNFLTGDIDIKEIAVWNDDYIETKPEESGAGCVEESYRLDRRNQVVTYTRSTVTNEGPCEGVSIEPIVSRLGDGYERLKIYRSLP